MSIEVGLALELLGTKGAANHMRARVWILAFWVVSLHVRLPIVGALEKLSTDTTFMRSLFRSCPLALLLDTGRTGQNGLHAERWEATVGRCVKLGDIAGGVIFRPLYWLRAVKYVFCLRG